MHRFQDVIDRVETARKALGLTKTGFARGFGMKPQSYNNFVGQQGSKPSIDLIYGVVAAYRINPEWLLNGVGDIFLGEDHDMERKQSPFEGPEKGGVKLAPPIGRKEKRLRQVDRKLEKLKRAFAELEVEIRSLNTRTYN